MDRPLCQACNVNLAQKEPRRPGTFRKKCTTCARGYSKKPKSYTEHKVDYCQDPECKWDGPLISYQLQVDHVDGNKTNNDPSNLMTRCANCHALKTYLAQEYLPLGQRGASVVIFADRL